MQEPLQRSESGPIEAASYWAELRRGSSRPPVHAPIRQGRMAHILIHDYLGDHVAPWLRGLVRYFSDRGADVSVWTRNSLLSTRLAERCNPSLGAARHLALRLIRRHLKGIDHVYMWNGQNDHHRLLREACAASGVPCSIVEVGYFPQRHWFTIDPIGINATSSLMTDPLDWVSDAHLEALTALRSSYLEGRHWRGTGGYTLIPLQLSQDTNVRDHTHVTDMQSFICECQARLSGRQLLFKQHPLDENDYRTDHELVRNGNFLDLAVEASEVIGLNSTCLLEAALLGVPTIALGNGFLRSHAHQVERLLAALVDKQVPVGSPEIGYWVERYSANGTPLA